MSKLTSSLPTPITHLDCALRIQIKNSILAASINGSVLVFEITPICHLHFKDINDAAQALEHRKCALPCNYYQELSTRNHGMQPAVWG